jgi:uncharacterized protein (DUF1015 family)
MVDIRPFKALRPRGELVSKVSSPPYDVIGEQEASIIINSNPYSFLKVTKPEATLKWGMEVSEHQLAKIAARNLKEMIENQIMIEEEKRCLYLYRQSNDIVDRTGIVACLSVDDYQQGIIKKHEQIEIKTWQGRVSHIKETKAHTGCPLLVYKSNNFLEELIKREIADREAIYDFLSDDGLRNCCWQIKEEEVIDDFRKAFRGIRALYIADGHHRTAAAAEVARIRDQKLAERENKNRDEEYRYFPALLIPHNQIRITGYHRLLKDLNGFSEHNFLKNIERLFEVEQITSNHSFLPTQKHEFGLNLAGQWYRLFFREDNFDTENLDIIDKLDVSILQNKVLNPLLGIKDGQKSTEVEFIGGGDALTRIEKGIQTGARIAFTLFPTSIEEVMEVSERGQIMPPKSTWFEPKVRSGIFVHLFE